MGDAFAALAFSIGLEKFTNLKEKHDKHGFREFRLRPGKKTYTKSPDGSHAHKEVFVEHFSFHNSFKGFFKRTVTDTKIRNQIHQQQLPGSKIAELFHSHGSRKKQSGDSNQQYLSFYPAMLMVMLIPVIGDAAALFFFFTHAHSYVR